MTVASATAIAASELRLIIRNRTVLIGATLVPLALGGYLIYSRESVGTGWTALTVMLIVFLALFSIYLTVTTTMATRREELFLKRLRSGEAPDWAIIAGMVAPIVLLLVAQLAIVLAAMFAVGAPTPEQPVVLLIAIAGVCGYCTTVGILTSIYTPSAAAAQITSLPFFGFVAATAIWALFADEWYLDLTPGGATTVLIEAAYESGSSLTNSIPAAASVIVWIVVPAVIALRTFRWEPRH